MEEKYIIEKEYTIKFEDFRDGYTAYQKKFVYTKSYIFMALFIVIAVIYIIAAVKDPSNTMAYVLIFISLALGFREWYNPRKIRRMYIDTFREIGELKNKIGIGENFADISTIPDENVEKITDEEENELPDELSNSEPIRISSSDSTKILEYDKFILLCVGKESFHIIPKQEWTVDELKTLRSVFSEG